MAINPCNNEVAVGKKKKTYSKIINFFGAILAIVSIFFVIFRLKSYFTNEILSFFTFNHITILIVVALIYGLVSVSLGCVWKNILAASGTVKSYRWSISIYGISQIAKYIPGNVFHFAGRQVLGMASGVPGKVLAKSTFLELALLVFCGSLFSIILIPYFLKLAPSFIIVSFFVFLITSLLCSYLISKFYSSFLAKAFIVQVVFLVFSGSIFYFLLCLINGFSFLVLNEDKHWFEFYVPAAFVTAWLIGLVTPGAPAGIGVREIVLIFLLGDYFDNGSILLSVTISRIVTVIGDVVFYIIAYFIKRGDLSV